MNTAVSTFTFAPGMNLRAFNQGDTPWFVAKDACAALGYAHAPSALTKHVDDDDRMPMDMNTVPNWHRTPGNPRHSIITESGLYALIMGSEQPQARAFKKWVTATVLPAIRKTGGYVMGEEKVKTGEVSMEEMTARVVAFMHTKLTGLEAERLVHLEQIAAAAPAVEFITDYMDAAETCTMTEVARQIGCKPRHLTALMLEDKVVYRTKPSAPLMPSAPYMNKGFFEMLPFLDSEGRNHPQTRVTTKGIAYLAKRYGTKG